MPHTSGTVTYFADRSGGGGTLGLLGELLDPRGGGVEPQLERLEIEAT